MRRGCASSPGTTQNDIIKEYLSRGTYAFPPGPSLRLITDMISYTVGEMPKWNPTNICSYHLQEAGSDPGPGDRLCHVHGDRGPRRGAGLRARCPPEKFPDVVARISFFVNAGRALRRRDVQDASLRPALGRAHAKSATASPTRSRGGSATACRSTPSDSPRRSRRTTSSASSWRCSR
ncbi:MAG: methylmalonyl-CoA mutase family protein [Dermatophilaceae bacterium]